MTPIRAVAAFAAIITALLLQATVIGPLGFTASASLPAVFVAAVALESGPGTGIALGFAAGLITDLGSAHPAGTLALCWLALGLGCGMVADSYRALPAQMAVAGLSATGIGVLATLLLTVLGAPGATAAGALRGLPGSLVGDLVFAAALVPITRRILRSQLLRSAATGNV